MAGNKPKAQGRRSSRMPIAWRLPNPPAVFVGRGADSDWLASAIERAPVSLVTGPGGLGKTALVLETLHQRFAKQVPRTIHVDVPPGQPAGQVRHEILRALAEVSGEGEVDWASLQGEPEVAISVAIDMAEEGQYWIVIDDVYQSDTDETDEMLVQLASFARKSRWIATSRLTPRLAKLAGQVLTLSAMSDGELRELARAWAKGADAVVVQRAIAASSGSPWLLHQLLVTGASVPALGEGGLLHGLAEDAAAFLRALALVEVPLPLGVLAQLSPEPSAETLASLERRGLVHQSTNGYRLHDVARGMLLGPTRDAARGPAAAHAAAVLAQQDLPDAWLEAARLLVALDRADALAGLLDARGDRLVAQGYAPRLWKVLREVDEPRVREWQLRCAAELGNPTALAQVRKPAGRDAGEILAWARTLRAQGDIDDAIARAQQVLAEPAAAPGSDLHTDAGFLLASCFRHVARYDDARAVLDAIAVSDEPSRLRRDAAVALVRVLGGAGERAVDLNALRRRAAGVAVEPETACDLAEALLAVGRLAEANDVLAAARTSPRGARPDLLASREASLVAARIQLATGNLDAARRLADEVRAFARGSSVLLPMLHVVDVTRRLIAGELEGLEPLVASCRSEALGIDAAMDVELQAAAVRIATLHASGATSVLEVAPEHAKIRATREAWLWESVRRTRKDGRSDARVGDDDGDPVASVIGRLVEAAGALASGDAARATAHAEDAVRRAARFGLRTLEAEARAVACDALLCAGRTADLARAAGELRALANAMPSARFAREAWLHALAASSRRLDPGALETVAAVPHTAPVAARRAQAILGGDPPLDHVDLRVLEALALSGRSPAIERIGPEPRRAEGQTEPAWVPGWGFDDATGFVWLPGGRTVDLSARGLTWKMLEVLASRGGEATKEQLVMEAWGEPEYHPLRHDGRLHVAVRKLRELIEDSVATPRRLLTTDDGYRLGDNPRRAS